MLRQASLVFVCALQVGCGRATLVPDEVDDRKDGGVDVVQLDGSSTCANAGAPDPAFGHEGVVPIFGLESGVHSVAEGVAIDSESRIVVAGGFIAGPRSCVLARLLPDGSRDPTFGMNGVVRGGIDDHVCWYTDVAIQVDGKIVAFGEIDGHTSPRALLTRYTVDGVADPSFGDDGMVLFDAIPVTVGLVVEIDPEQRVLVAGEIDSKFFFTRRYLSNGALDPSFGSGGNADQVFEDFDVAAVRGIGVQGDGRIVVAGGVSRSPDVGAAGIARYNGNGSVDPSFGAGGQLADDGMMGTGDVVFDSLERLVLPGAMPSGGALLRLMSDGTRDVTFGSDGVVAEPPKIGLVYGDVAISGENLLALGNAPEGGGEVELIRYLTNGVPDAAFGIDGFAHRLPTVGGNQRAGDLAVQANGNIVVVGGYGDSDSFDIFVAQYCP